MTEGNISPLDHHNQRLLSHVHPADWENPVPIERYNLVVIGGGTAGLVAAVGAAGLGAKVALIEKHLLGGDCLNVGCVPSKAIIRSARAAVSKREAGGFGIEDGEDSKINFSKVMERVRRLRAEISPHDSAARLKSLGIDVFFGASKFIGKDLIEVAGQELRFSKAVIATGSRSSVPAIPGLDKVPFLTNETLFSLTELPNRLGVIGAGPIGCEMAQAFGRLGSEVVLIGKDSGVLPRDDREGAAIVQMSIARDGVRIFDQTEVLNLSSDSRGTCLTLGGSGQRLEVWVDQILIAAGRSPDVEGLGLELAGVEVDKNGVKVNDLLQTTNPSIYACGDVSSSFKFTHAADFMARIVIRNALFKGRSKASSLIIPWATYTSPEIAQVGASEDEAEAKGILIQTFLVEFKKVDRAVLDGETEGFIKVHVRKGSDKILGATVVSSHAGELIGELTLAMNAGIGLKTIAATIHPYPTQSEAIRKIGDLYNKTRLSPGLKRIFEHWMKWQR
jgi:pyruvate/2-oxoglutarate dehydrogenase complex dihydrolipoamide dehydrogenase (E3) component